MGETDQKRRAPRNRTIVLCAADRERLRGQLLHNPLKARRKAIAILLGDCLALAPHLPRASVDLLFLDPPYNLRKSFGGVSFARMSVEGYTSWLEGVLRALAPLLKRTATVYICGDWVSSPSIQAAASRHFVVRNRITWEREKGRGARRNWKNASEDIWFCTVSGDYCFNLDEVKLRRRVIAPYTRSDGSPKDWRRTEQGGFRDTHPSNLWTDLTIPFWSMTENTDHPTQKSEKLLAKLLLASTHPGDLVLDPFLGSGTTCAVAQKLGRRALGIEIDEEYALWGLRRLELAKEEPTIQGYTDGVFWERNTLAHQLRRADAGRREKD